MDPTDFQHWPAADGAASDDVSPYGGAINTSGSQLADGTPNGVINAIWIPSLGSPDNVYRGSAWRKNAGTGTLGNAAMCLRAGAVLNASPGIPQIVSTNPLDTDRKVIVTGQVSAAWAPQTLTANGMTPVFGTNLYDALQAWRWECTDVSGTPTSPRGNLSCFIGSQLLGVIWGTDSGFPTIMATAEFELAIALAFDTSVTGSNRLSDPASGITAFFRSVYLRSVDTSIAVPGGLWSPTKTLAYVLRLTAKAGVPKPAAGYFQSMVTPFGDPQ